MTKTRRSLSRCTIMGEAKMKQLPFNQKTDKFLDQQKRLDIEYRRAIVVHTLPCVDCGVMVTGSLSDGTYLINADSDGTLFGMCEKCNAAYHPSDCDCLVCRALWCNCPQCKRDRKKR